jgi:hypothetical protein
VFIQPNRPLAYILEEEEEDDDDEQEEEMFTKLPDARSARLPNGTSVSPTSRDVFLCEWLLKSALGREGGGECLEMCLIGNFKQLPTLTDSSSA